MTVRNLLSGATLAAATFLVASSASAQVYTYSVLDPTAGEVLATIGSTNVVVTGLATNVPALGDGFVGLTPFFNFNRNNDTSNGTAANVATTLTVQAFRDGVAATNSQTLNFTNNFTSNNAGNGSLTLNNFSANFTTTSFTFNFAAGGGFGASTLTLSNFGFSNASGIAGNPQSADGIIGFNNITVNPPRGTGIAPEPGSLALAATGLMGALGMVIRRRRSAK